MSDCADVKEVNGFTHMYAVGHQWPVACLPVITKTYSTVSNYVASQGFSCDFNQILMINDALSK